MFNWLSDVATGSANTLINMLSDNPSSMRSRPQRMRKGGGSPSPYATSFNFSDMVAPTMGGQNDWKNTIGWLQDVNERSSMPSMLGAYLPKLTQPVRYGSGPTMMKPRPVSSTPTMPVSPTVGDTQSLESPAVNPVSTPAPTGDGTLDDGIDHSSRDAFINSVLPYAVSTEATYGIPAEFLIAMNLNEQGWQHAAPGNNYFGIKGKNKNTGRGTGPVNTWEDYGAGAVNVQDEFRAYSNIGESYNDFVDFLKTNSRYNDAMLQFEQDHDGEALIRNIHKAGYATDPAWSDKIISIAGEVRAKRAGRAASYLNADGGE